MSTLTQHPLEISVPSAIGLGTLICFFSFLAHVNRPSRLKVIGNHRLYNDLKRILSIPDDKILIENSNDFRCAKFIPADHIKFFSPYIRPDSVRLFDQIFPVRINRRPCVVLGIHSQSLDTLPGSLGDTFPENRQYSIDIYDKIFHQFSRAGYDVISLNSERISLEQKIFVLNEMCDCVITYEGGLAHLAHILQIPCIVLPWRYGAEGDPPAENVAERYNLDRKTYFPTSVDELLSWSKQEIQIMIEDLYQDNGNNLLMSNDLTIDQNTLEVWKPNKNFSFRPWLDDDNINLIRNNLDQIRVGG